jgi:hypothetical protein
VRVRELRGAKGALLPPAAVEVDLQALVDPETAGTGVPFLADVGAARLASRLLGHAGQDEVVGHRPAPRG